MRNFSLLLASAFLAFSLQAEAAPASFSWLSEVRYQLGDDPAWASPNFDDSAWEDAFFGDLPGAEGLIWIRGELEVAVDQRRPGEPLGLGGAMLATCEIHWDGELLPPRGKVGTTAETEVPGPIEFLLHIPDRLATPGSHLLALRCSTHHRHFEPTRGFWLVAVGPYEDLALLGRGTSWQALASLSGMLIFAIFFLALFVLEPVDRSHLLLGLFSLTAAALLVTEAWRSLVPYPYSWHLLRLVAVTVLTWVLSLLLIAFLLTRFRLPQRRRVLGLTGLLTALPMLLVPSWDGKVLAMLGVLGVFGLLLAGQAVRRRERGSGLVAVGILFGFALGILQPSRFADQGFYLALDLLLVCLLISHAFQLRRTREEREEARLKSARLEIELLKRQLQPHFLMNTLTALSEWIEEDPAVAGKMIQALAEEFRLLSEISSQKLISMAQELRLCRHHLEIMSYRRDCTFRLTTEGVDEGALIPPAVLHTLVENALTHNRYLEAEVEFHLRQQTTESEIRWIFQAPLGVGVHTGEAAEGTGLRYIRARLREGFGERARCFQGPQGETWHSEILVPSGLRKTKLREGSSR